MMTSTLPGCIITLFFTAVCTLQDLRTLRIDLRIFLAMGAAELLWYPLMYFSGSVPDCRSLLAAACAGALLFLFSFLSSGAFGEGDALFFLLLGTAAGHRLQLLILFVSVLLAGIFALLFLVRMSIRGQSAGNRCFPFLPFAAVPAFCFLLQPFLMRGGAPLP